MGKFPNELEKIIGRYENIAGRAQERIQNLKNNFRHEEQIRRNTRVNKMP